MKVVGLDLSLSSTGIAVVDLLDPTTTATTTATAPKTGPIEERVLALGEDIWDAAQLRGTQATGTLVVVEDLAPVAGKPNLVGGLLAGWVRCSLHDAGNPLLVVTPQHIKKYATGKGNANKDMVRDAARDRFGLPAGVTSDECDALWAAAIGCALVGRPLIDLPKTHVEALAKLTLPEGCAA